MKNNPKQKKSAVPASVPAAAPKKAKPGRRLPAWSWLLAISLVTLLTYWPSTSNQLTIWDDGAYISENGLIQNNLSWASLNGIIAGNWQPGLIAQLWAEYHLFGLKKVEASPQNNNTLSISTKTVSSYDGTDYHIVSLMMHLLNALFLFLFLRQFCRYFFSEQDSQSIALLATMVFGIHPMHVESVCWASETKDVGYAMWYHAALWVFCLYLGKKELKYLLVTLVLFILSLLYKGQAVTLPLALALIAMVQTYSLTNRKVFSWKEALPGWFKSLTKQEIVFFIIALALSLLVGRMAFYAQATTESLLHPELNNISFLVRLIEVCYGLGNYILKSVVPFGFSMIHHKPEQTDGMFDWYVYMYALLPFLVLGSLWWFRTNPIVTFGILFFLIHILPVSEIIQVGTSNYSERYTYIAYDGLTLLIAYMAVYYYPRYKVLTTGIVICMAIFYIYSTYDRSKVWHDSKTLYLDGVKLNPRNSVLNGYLGIAYFQEGDIDKAKKYLDASVAVSNMIPEVLATRAHIFVGRIRPDMSVPARLALLDSAIYDCDLSLINRNDSANAVGGLGICYSMKGDITGNKIMFDSARMYLIRALDLHGGQDADIYLNIGHTFNNSGNADSALAWYSKAIATDSTLWTSYIYRGMLLFQKGKPNWAKAAEDFKMAQVHDADPAKRELAKQYLQTITNVQ